MSILRRRFPALLPLAFAAAVAGAAETPPRELHVVGDHWTAWNPPETLPEGANVHTIVRGDTLWDLAAKFLGDPYLWPQLWEQNRYILDAHWIYPGDPLLIGLEVASGETTGDGALTDGEEVADAAEPELPPIREEGHDRLDGLLTADQAASEPGPLGYESDLECGGYVGEMEEQFPVRMIGSENDALRAEVGDYSTKIRRSAYGELGRVRINLADSDIVYLDGGHAAGLYPGQLLAAIEPNREIRDPHRKRETLGRLYRYLARVRVLSVQENTAIGEVTSACEGVPVGIGLTPYEPEPVPLGRTSRMRPVNFPPPAAELATAPRIVASLHGLLSLGQDHLVFVDLGAEADVAPGDFYSIYRRNRDGLPPVVLGELVVVSTRGKLALGRILASRYTVLVGDSIQSK